MTRRKFFGSLFGTGVLSAVSLYGYSTKIEPIWIDFETHALPIRNLPDNWVGKTVLQVTDMHINKHSKNDAIINVFQKTAKLEPDLVVCTGDLLTNDDDDAFGKLDTVLSHLPQGKMGSWGCLGNHDYGQSFNDHAIGDQVIATAARNNLTIFQNEAIEIEGLTIGGVEDLWTSRFDLPKLLQNVGENDPFLALIHNPDVCDFSIWGKQSATILSGHTHGGQIKPPFMNPPILPVKNSLYQQGFYDVSPERLLYISRGIGASHNVRFNCRPEITLFVLENKVS